MDVVYLVRRGENNEELRLSLRSLRHLPHDRVWFVGHLPRWVTGVEHIPGNRSTQSAVNVFNGVLAACEHPDLSDDIVLMNDDFMLFEPPDLAPAYRCTLREHLGLVRGRRDPWAKSLHFTLAWLTRRGFDEPLSFELHRPIVLNRAAMSEVLREVGSFGWPTPPQWRTVYGNLCTPEAARLPDWKRHNWSEDLETAPLVSTSDGSFPRLRPHLEGRFPDPSPYERAAVMA